MTGGSGIAKAGCLPRIIVYILTNSTRVVLYVGVTSDLEKRVWQHQHGETEGFTKRYNLNRLVVYEMTSDALSAITREKQIKAWRRQKKNELVTAFNPTWADLAATLWGGK